MKKTVSAYFYLIVLILSTGTHLVFSQETAETAISLSTLEVHENNGFRFELNHLPSACPECEGCICKTIIVYDKNGKILHNQRIDGKLNSPRMMDKMDVFDFNFDGYPDFRLVDFDVNFDSYYIYQPLSENFLVHPLLSECSNLFFYSETKEAIGFRYGQMGLDSKNLTLGSDLNTHRFQFNGTNLEHIKIESKLLFFPWTDWQFYEDTLTPKFLYARNCTFKNFVLEQHGEVEITQGNFSAFPANKDTINQRIKTDNFAYLQHKIGYKEAVPSNYILYRDQAKDTTFQNKHYAWVVYDLNRTPFEIGEDYTNGIKNGEWIKRDQQGRIISVEKYSNDTLNGMANYYYYHNFPWNVTRFYGLNLKGCKVGEWTYFQSGRFKSLSGKWHKDQVRTYDLSGNMFSVSNFMEKEKLENKLFYSANTKVVWYLSFTKKGTIKESVPYPILLKTLDKSDN